MILKVFFKLNDSLFLWYLKEEHAFRVHNLFLRLEAVLKQRLEISSLGEIFDAASPEFKPDCQPCRIKERLICQSCALAKWWWPQEHHNGIWVWDGCELEGGSGATWENMKWVNRLMTTEWRKKYSVAGKSCLNRLLDAWLFSEGNAGSSCSRRYFQLWGHIEGNISISREGQVFPMCYLSALLLSH